MSCTALCLCLCVCGTASIPTNTHIYCELIQQNAKAQDKEKVYVCACCCSLNVMLCYIGLQVCTECLVHTLVLALCLMRIRFCSSTADEISTDSDKENVNERKNVAERNGEGSGMECEIMSDKHKYIFHIRFARTHIY